MDIKLSDKMRHIFYVFLNFFKYCVFVFSIIGACTQIYTIAFDKSNSKTVSLIILFVLVFIISIIGIVLNRFDLSIFLKTQIIVSHSREILHGLRDDFYEAKNILTEANNIKAKEQAVIGMLMPIVRKISESLKDITGADVRTCIKIINVTKTNENLDEVNLKTICRNTHRSENQAYNEYIQSNISIVDNTDFNLILNGIQDKIHIDDLLSYSRKNTYLNSNLDWRNQYRATMIFPIRLKTSNHKRNVKYDLIGFLCVDTKQRTAFIGRIGKLCENYCIGIADTLYVYLKQIYEITNDIKSIDNDMLLGGVVNE